ncbi:MAG TPA: HAD-IIIA family hydrolase, partial [Thermoplasmata archaeon]|nr:HAD-IIIA family hydrolase [Thermoplasmata archaeon]
GYLVVCVTNQSGIERGLYSEADVHRIHARVNEILAARGTRVDAFYYCPHAPERGCACRKPGTLLFKTAAQELGISFSGSAIIGDRALDVEAGEKLGLETAIAVPPGHLASVEAELAATGATPDIVALSFEGAVHRLLGRG